MKVFHFIKAALLNIAHKNEATYGSVIKAIALNCS